MPDFYLGSGEHKDLNRNPRSCTILREIPTPFDTTFLLVAVDPPLPASRGEALTVVLLAPRHAGVTIAPVSEWPAHVHVAQLDMDDPAQLTEWRDGVSHSEYWGKLDPTADAALAAVDPLLADPTP